MERMGVTGVAAISVIAYLLGEVAKASRLDNKWIPIVCGVAGGLLGLLGMAVMPAFPAEDVITALAVGIVSGLAATGADQIIKQMKESRGRPAAGALALAAGFHQNRLLKNLNKIVRKWHSFRRTLHFLYFFSRKRRGKGLAFRGANVVIF